MPDKYCTNTAHTTYTWTVSHERQELRERKDLNFRLTAADVSYLKNLVKRSTHNYASLMHEKVILALTSENKMGGNDLLADHPAILVLDLKNIQHIAKDKLNSRKLL